MYGEGLDSDGEQVRIGLEKRREMHKGCTPPKQEPVHKRMWGKSNKGIGCQVNKKSCNVDGTSECGL